MKFITHNQDDNINISGTSLQGDLHFTSYEQLTRAFGEPMVDIWDKSQCQWNIKFEDGTIATIYDWKDHRQPENINRWKVGGFNKKAFNLVKLQLGL